MTPIFFFFFFFFFFFIIIICCCSSSSLFFLEILNICLLLIWILLFLYFLQLNLVFNFLNLYPCIPNLPHASCLLFLLLRFISPFSFPSVSSSSSTQWNSVSFTSSLVFTLCSFLQFLPFSIFLSCSRRSCATRLTIFLLIFRSTYNIWTFLTRCRSPHLITRHNETSEFRRQTPIPAFRFKT